MSEKTLAELLAEFFGDEAVWVQIMQVDVDPLDHGWTIFLCMPQHIDCDEAALGSLIHKAYPFLQRVDIRRQAPETLSQICTAEALKTAVYSSLGTPAGQGDWRYSEQGELMVTLYSGEDKYFIAALEKQIARLTGLNSKVHVLHPMTKEADVLLGRPIRSKLATIGELNEESGTVCVEGEVFACEFKKTRAVRDDKPLAIFTFSITDFAASITAKIFDVVDVTGELRDSINPGMRLRIRGECKYDKFAREAVISARDINILPVVKPQDNMPEKRVELHLHTQMSAMDATASVKDVINTAADFGHAAVAITDHGVVQAFPDAAELAKKRGIKLILGVEAYMTADAEAVNAGGEGIGFDAPCVILDIETTGLDANNCGITEIGAVRMVKGESVEEFQTFVNPGQPIPAKIVHLTGITDAMVADAPGEEAALRELFAFIKDDVLVAHNASFDIGFINTRGRPFGLEITQPVVDTLTLSRAMFPTMRRHKLDIMCNKLNINLTGHHRAVNDATATGLLFYKLLEMAVTQFGCNDIATLNSSMSHARGAAQDHHVILLVQNQQGLKNLYKLVSYSHLKYFHGKPRMPKEVIQAHRDGLIIGSACEAGEIFRAFLDGKDEHAQTLGNFYDYFEIQPDGNNAFLLRNERLSNLEALHDINRKIIALGARQKKPVVATGDVHFIRPQDEYFRRILQHGQKFSDADQQPPLYFRNTAQMLEEFAWLGEDEALEVVVRAPNAVAAQIEAVDPLPPYALYAPKIDGAEEYIVDLSWQTARDIYGENLPELVEKRLNKELASITKYGFGVLFYIAHKLVKKSLEDDYLVGSRGSVGSSFVATMTGITEVNPLPAHYICTNPKCKHSDFDVDSEAYPCGPDLPDATCPLCGTKYKKEGFDIAFEVFLGFEGDKVPDIDLNFSGDYQPVMHRYTEELFGKENVFRAGTIGTVADRTAYGFVINYLQEKGVPHNRAEVERLVKGCAGVKRTTGQHPAGMIVVPKEYEIYDFTPVQHPADDKESEIITTHFDFNSLHDRLVKLDILGHDDPTMLRMLKDLTGIDPRDIDIMDEKVISLFSGTEALGVTPEDINSQSGTYGVPEFGTRFVRGMLEDTAPTTLTELLRISGLSHGTDVWLGNAQDLIRNGTATLREAVCTRDDIMDALIHKGVDNKMAFNIMESVRKGKGLSADMENAMLAANVPGWFIDSCKKIQYMFPRSHAVAYVLMALRVAWYKVYHPKPYYAAYYTVRADDFDASLMLGDAGELKRNIKTLEGLDDSKQKDKNKLTILEIVLEMRCRGIDFAPIDLYQSHANEFLVLEDGRIRPPLNALPGLGINAAQKLVATREEGSFTSQEDIKKRAGVSSAVIDVLVEFRCVDALGAKDQISLFELMA